MAFADFKEQAQPVALLQRSLERGRLGHAYLFTGSDIALLERAAATLACTLNCETPPRRGANGQALDCCGQCSSCRKITGFNHPDVTWVRPESKSRVITIDQMRAVMQTIHLKPSQASWKVSVVVAAERMNPAAANAFLKTLEEPPLNSILVLLSADPERLLETIHSRCLRLHFAGESDRWRDESFQSWLSGFSQMAAAGSKSLLSRYRLLSLLLERLRAIRESIETTLKEASPLQDHEDLDPKLKERWEDELEAAIEAEYRHRRWELLAGLQWWFRDVWLSALGLSAEGLSAFPHLEEPVRTVAGRLSVGEAMDNLAQLEHTQRLLASNVQEGLALEVGLLRLKI